MGKEPWRHRAADGAAQKSQKLSYAESLDTPCATCSTAACCTYLPLHTLAVDTLASFDHMRYLLNFEHVELGINADGNWSAFYRYPCRFFDRETHRCELHETPEQPRVCVHYSPYKCWYRKALGVPNAETYLRIDRRRLDLIGQQITFDDDRRIVEVPEWNALVLAFASLPLQDDATSAAAPTQPSAAWDDPVFETWKRQVLEPAEAEKTKTHRYAELQDPCDGCGAFCCENLIFPLPLPQTAVAMDYLRFVLGFPGLEIGISENHWGVIVKTRCRHLGDDKRCQVYGEPERPLVCKYHDATSCSYKWQFGKPRPDGFFRVRLDQFDAMASAFEFDESGHIILFPQAELIRDTIENEWKNPGSSRAEGPRKYQPVA